MWDLGTWRALGRDPGGSEAERTPLGKDSSRETTGNEERRARKPSAGGRLVGRGAEPVTGRHEADA